MRLIFTDLTYDKLGGGENMIYEIVKHAKIHHGIDSILLGSEKSFVLKRLNEEGVDFVFVDDSKKIEYEDELSDLFVHFHNYDGLHRLKSLRGRSIIWGILTPQITEWNRFGIEKKVTGRKIAGNYYTRRLIAHLRSKNGLISMDGATSDAIDSFFGERLNLPVIPIPVDIKDARPAKTAPKKNYRTLQISYIGRSDDNWKITPIKKFAKDLGRLKSEVFEINIYTDKEQPYIEQLKEVSCRNVSFRFHIGLYGPKIRDHISQNSDLHVSMGTAAIEGALSGIPTILIDPCVSDLPENYRYKWLYETERCSLGRFVAPEEDHFTGLSIAEVVTCLGNSKEYSDIAERSLDYVKRNHSTEVVVRKLIQHPTIATNMDITRHTPATWNVTRKIASIASAA